jgi:hypothetical protein
MIGFRKTLSTGLCAVVLMGCGAAPFVTVNPSLSPPNGEQVVSICYDANATTREEIAAIAQKECKEEGAGLNFWVQDKTLNECPILAKIRVSFLCIPPQ